MGGFYLKLAGFFAALAAITVAGYLIGYAATQAAWLITRAVMGQ